MDNTIKKEDYIEPNCPLCAPDAKQMIPVARILEKLDEYLGANDYDAAKRHLDYWMADAKANFDKRGELSLLNEKIGLYRKLLDERALEFANSALTLAKELGYEGTITMGTTLVNAATAFKAFEKPEEALPLYEQAKSIYEKLLPGDDARLGGLYNNMALALLDLAKFDQAEALFNKAIDVMQKNDGDLEIAITHCNLADLWAAKFDEAKSSDDDGAFAQSPNASDANLMAQNEAKIFAELNTAYELLSSHKERDGYYAFVCEKCAPSFQHYGMFVYAQELQDAASSIYESNKN